MNLPFMALILVFLVVVWLFLRLRRAKAPNASRAASRTGSGNPAFHAVSIKFSDTACAAARELDGRRFLSSAAPKLPLAECDVLECKCRFVHHKDRRAGKDRRSPFGPSGFGTATGKFEVEQRKARDRRAKSDEDLF
ncbi:MAG: hypothetical protein OEM85_01110 [Gammaproteobacteria bacterium]|nr:hypothetical protein [Gammaproteobacteria bacterium]MDH3408517.1 hypothetical protein [Gammaproteobacteria bacterium]